MTTHSGRGQGDEGPYEGVVLPSDGAPWTPEQQAAPQPPQPPQPSQGTPWGTPWGPESQAPPPSPLPESQAPPPLPGPQPPADDATQMLPPAQPYGGSPMPPYAGYGGQQPPMDADATQMMPPHPGTPPPGPDAEATQYMPYQPQPQSQPYGPDADATRMLPPQGAAPGQPLPPESVGDPHAAAGPPPPSAPYGIRPGAPGDRQPPAEFDNLFRADPPAGPAGPAGPPPPQQPPAMPYQGQGQGQAAGWQPDGGGYSGYDGHTGYGDHDGGGRGGVSPRVLIGVGVAALVAIGLITGAALSGGDGDPQAKDGGTPSAAPAGNGESAAPDDAKAQAKALSGLLAQSNNSRNAVIGAVQNIKKCEDLAKAAQDLRDAANQRESLVKKLGDLETGALPQHDALTSALTDAWNASAEADNAYAAWGDQVAGDKGCHKGKARSTHQQAKGNRASGDASAAKKEAAKLWNPIARKYGLDERQASQL